MRKPSIHLSIAEEQALVQAKAIDEAGIDADKMSFQEFHLLLRITSLQTVFSQLAPQKCYNYERISDARQVANTKTKGA